jgi:hypothetical protein
MIGIFAGIMGMEHGLGEIFQGPNTVPNLVILSWADSSFFEPMGGEPAMTFFPNFLLAGIFSILFSFLFLVILLKQGEKKYSWIALLITAVCMLLSGAGFGPPLLGIIISLITIKLNSPLKAWRKLSEKTHKILSSLWPFAYGLCFAGWLVLFPGAVLIKYFTGFSSVLLMLIPIAIAFSMIPVTLVFGFSRDILMEKAEK